MLTNNINNADKPFFDLPFFIRFTLISFLQEFVLNVTGQFTPHSSTADGGISAH